MPAAGHHVAHHRDAPQLRLGEEPRHPPVGDRERDVVDRVDVRDVVARQQRAARRGRCSPPANATRAPNIVNGHSAAIAAPNQNPEPRRRRVTLSASTSWTRSGLVVVPALVMPAPSPSRAMITRPGRGGTRGGSGPVPPRLGSHSGGPFPTGDDHTLGRARSPADRRADGVGASGSVTARAARRGSPRSSRRGTPRSARRRGLCHTRSSVSRSSTSSMRGTA